VVYRMPDPHMLVNIGINPSYAMARFKSSPRRRRQNLRK
jgi:hypothetical protein